MGFGEVRRTIDSEGKRSCVLCEFVSRLMLTLLQWKSVYATDLVFSKLVAPFAVGAGAEISRGSTRDLMQQGRQGNG